jgi:dUTP pyrophosphatase
MIKLEWKPLTETAKAPSKAYSADAAYDLYADLAGADLHLKPGETKIVPTGIAIMPPEGWCCDIRGRSGMNSKGKFVILGLVDANYTGPWGIVVHNGTEEYVTINHHDKIAQFTLNKIYESELERVENFNLSSGARGTGGFGSSGKK